MCQALSDTEDPQTWLTMRQPPTANTLPPCHPQTKQALSLLPQSLHHKGALLTHFPDQKTEAQGGRKTRPGSQGQPTAEPDSNSGLSGCKPYALSLPSLSFSYPFSFLSCPPNHSICLFSPLVRDLAFSSPLKTSSPSSYTAWSGELLFILQKPAWVCPPGSLPDSSRLG